MLSVPSPYHAHHCRKILMDGEEAALMDGEEAAHCQGHGAYIGTSLLLMLHHPNMPSHLESPSIQHDILQRPRHNAQQNAALCSQVTFAKDQILQYSIHWPAQGIHHADVDTPLQGCTTDLMVSCTPCSSPDQWVEVHTGSWCTAPTIRQHQMR